MTRTILHRARACVDAQRADVDARAAAFETFAERVSDVPATPATATPVKQAASATVGTGRPSTTALAQDGGCADVREAFADAVVPHTIGDGDSLAETLAAELTEDVAIALATDAGWSPVLKAAVLESAANRRREADRLRERLRCERRTLEDAIDETDDLVAWLQSTADESLYRCGFDELRAKHEHLHRRRERLESLVADRQAQFTDSTTGRESGASPSRTLVVAIYSSLSVRYPILSTATRLERVCRDCQRTLRAHLVRRV